MTDGGHGGSSRSTGGGEAVAAPNDGVLQPSGAHGEWPPERPVRHVLGVLGVVGSDAWFVALVLGCWACLARAIPLPGGPARRGSPPPAWPACSLSQPGRTVS